jgi:hypothetical protein
MPSLPNSDEVLKALLAAVGSALVSRLSGIFEVLTDPHSPRKRLEDAKQILANMDAAAKVMVELNQLPPSAWRGEMEAALQDVLHRIGESQQGCSEELLNKRNKILKVLSLMRLNMPQSLWKGVFSFLFYTSLVLTIQSIHLYLAGVHLNSNLLWMLSLISVLFWWISGSKTSSVAANISEATSENLENSKVLDSGTSVPKES